LLGGKYLKDTKINKFEQIKGRKVTLGSDINVDISDEVLNGFNDLFEDDSFGKFCFEHILCWGLLF
jgi:hypothetical protein